MNLFINDILILVLLYNFRINKKLIRRKTVLLPIVNLNQGLHHYIVLLNIQHSGTDLEYRQSYMECNMKSAQLGDEGNFSLSLLVYVEKFEEKGSGVIFAYGDEGKPAVFKLWHHSMYVHAFHVS